MLRDASTSKKAKSSKIYLFQTCSHKAKLSKLGNRLAVSQEIIKPIIDHQTQVGENLQLVKGYLEDFRERLPRILKYSETFSKMIPVVIKDLKQTISFIEIERMLAKSTEKGVIEFLSHYLAALDAIILIVDPTKLTVAVTAVFSTIGLVMNIVQQEKENDRLKQQLDSVEVKWQQMEETLQHLVDNSDQLHQSWDILKNISISYAENLANIYIRFQSPLPVTLNRPLPGRKMWKDQIAQVKIENWDKRYQIRPELDLPILLTKIFQLQVNTEQAKSIGEEVNKFLEELESDFDRIFAKYLNGTSESFTTSHKIALLKSLAPAINERLYVSELVARSRRANLEVDRTSLFTLISNLMPNQKCYGLYPLELVRSNQQHVIFSVDFSESTIDYIKRKTKDHDYPIDSLVRNLKRRQRRSQGVWTREVVLYLLAGIYPYLSTYMGQDLDARRICTSNSWVTAFSLPEERDLSKDLYLTTVPLLTREWKVSFDFKHNNFTGLKQVLHMTTGGKGVGSRSSYGDRTPAIWAHPSRGFLVTSAVGGRTSFANYVKLLPPPGEWISVEVGQELVGSNVVYFIDIGGRRVFNTTNSMPSEFENVQVYASSSWYNPVNGTIRNLLIQKKENGLSISETIKVII